MAESVAVGAAVCVAASGAAGVEGVSAVQAANTAEILRLSASRRFDIGGMAGVLIKNSEQM
ncbi:hypothetical protein ABB30_09700 [Stenotrophomonas ginsengisoli]|uniref:Uncharacterized protein n=1 Tax=Stenotrophomonas ginsengisoli TaxID=336566 RepID=A0A0R0DE70_9GAMM|nr:hypothetical protein ABB30_09700 [Stenotrophomonas ginsengisoli]